MILPIRFLPLVLGGFCSPPGAAVKPALDRPGIPAVYQLVEQGKPGTFERTAVRAEPLDALVEPAGHLILVPGARLRRELWLRSTHRTDTLALPATSDMVRRVGNWGSPIRAYPARCLAIGRDRPAGSSCAHRPP